jgi:cyclopropane fatty-acyl-phospholipid synthase-like methyltransferase
VAGRVLPTLPGLAGRDDLRVLDLGCGAGENLVALARALPRGRVVGVDIEPRSIERANQRLREEGLADRAQARLAPAEALDERAGFDLVTLIQVLHETREEARAEILARAHAALRPGGLLLLVDEPYPEDPQQLRAAPWTALQQLVEIFWGNVFLSPETQQRMLREAGFEIVTHATLPPGLLCLTLARRPE